MGHPVRTGDVGRGLSWVRLGGDPSRATFSVEPWPLAISEEAMDGSARWKLAVGTASCGKIVPARIRFERESRHSLTAEDFPSRITLDRT